MGKTKNRRPAAKPTQSRARAALAPTEVAAEDTAGAAGTDTTDLGDDAAEATPEPASDQEQPTAEVAADDGTSTDAAPADADDDGLADQVDAAGTDDASRPGADAPTVSEVAATDELDGAESVRGVELAGEGVEFQEGEAENTEEFLKGLVEAILFTADHPLSARDVARAARIDRRRAQELIDILAAETRHRGVRVIEVADGYAYRTNPAYGSPVRDFLSQKPVRLSRAQLETLAIIAYRQPVTRPEVDDIRGVDSGAVLKTLLERDLLRILGKKDEPGRPMIYGTTPQFLDLFSLKSLRDLPTLREFTELSDDSRAKFELELGEVAPEGPIQFPEPTSASEAADAADGSPVEAAEASDQEAASDPEGDGTSEEASDEEAPLSGEESGASDDDDGSDEDDDEDDDDDDDDEDGSDEDDDDGDDEDDDDDDDDGSDDDDDDDEDDEDDEDDDGSDDDDDDGDDDDGDDDDDDDDDGSDDKRA